MNTSVVEERIRNCRSLPVDRYARSYPAILEFFANWRPSSVADLGLACTIVYGWMPTTIKWDPSVTDLSFGEALRASPNMSPAFQTAVALFEGSVIAASKLAHFLNPTEYPIWDRRVSIALGNGKSYYRVNRLSAYNEYRALILDIARSPSGATAVRTVERLTSYSVSPVRAIEMIVFYSQSSIERT